MQEKLDRREDSLHKLLREAVKQGKPSVEAECRLKALDRFFKTLIKIDFQLSTRVSVTYRYSLNDWLMESLGEYFTLLDSTESLLTDFPDEHLCSVYKDKFIFFFKGRNNN